MGKLTDAFEKHRGEASINADKIHVGPEQQSSRQKGMSEEEFCSINACHPKLVVLSAPDSIDAEYFKMLRSQMLMGKNGDRPRTIMVTSAYPGEGKTFVSANLAASMAFGIDEHVLVVDADLRHPGLHEILGYRNSAGLSDYLMGKKDLKDLIIRTQIEKLSMLTAGKVPPNPSELLCSTLMEDTINELKSRYEDRFVIIDSTPGQVTAEIRVLAQYVDGVILVLKALTTPREAARKMIQNLGREKVLGVVFNGFEKESKEYKKLYHRRYYKNK